MMLVEKSFDTGEVALNYTEGPNNGPPLVLLHGVTSRWQTFNPIINEFINRWHIYALDFRGHGKSGRTPEKYGLRCHYNDTVKFTPSGRARSLGAGSVLCSNLHWLDA
jgi:pimeloyl-ACP methyl ester carboxylesterase